MALKKHLSFIDVFSIAAGAMISSGIFILPGIAFAKVGPIIFMAYALAGLLALMGALSVIELATAMPKAGGVYYFVNRSMGPMSGTLLGIFSWVAISLKSAFAIFGMSEVLHLVTGMPLIPTSLMLTALFVGLNIYGVKEVVKLEVALVMLLLAIMAAYIVLGMPRVDVARFDPMVPFGFNSILITAGFVFVSFGGLVSVASIAEEVKNPRRNIPLGLLGAILAVTLFYSLLLLVTVGILPAREFAGSLTPIADSARRIAGTTGFVVISIAAGLAFVTTAISGIMAASRFPLALGRDRLIPAAFSGTVGKDGTPLTSLLVTGSFIAVMLLLPLDLLVKAASTVILTANLFANVAVIILRESKLQNYKPSFRVPLYPWLPILSILVFGVFIVDMGLQTIEISLGMLVVGLAVYVLYGRRHNTKEYALLHLINRILRRELRTKRLEKELLHIVHERDEVVRDQFDHLVSQAVILDLPATERLDFFMQAAPKLDLPGLPEPDQLARSLEEREVESSTALTPFVAVPHTVVEGKGLFSLVVARCKEGVYFSPEAPAVKALFVLVGSKDTRLDHLRALSAIAQTVSQEEFPAQWVEARTEENLRDLLLLSKRRRTPQEK